MVTCKPQRETSHYSQPLRQNLSSYIYLQSHSYLPTYTYRATHRQVLLWLELANLWESFPTILTHTQRVCGSDNSHSRRLCGPLDRSSACHLQWNRLTSQLSLAHAHTRSDQTQAFRTLTGADGVDVGDTARHGDNKLHVLHLHMDPHIRCIKAIIHEATCCLQLSCKLPRVC